MCSVNEQCAPESIAVITSGNRQRADQEDNVALTHQKNSTELAAAKVY